MLSGKRILLGVSGGIAAYKACELARMLMREGAEVQVVLTPAAAQFVTPLTFEALTLRPALVSEFPDPLAAAEHDIYAHLNLPRAADCFAVVPASANTIARLAGGQADNLLCAAYLSNTAPVVIAPAMNVRMWQHPAVQDNVARLRSRGNVVVEPGTGELACGDHGAGRLADLTDIFVAIARACGAKDDPAAADASSGQPLAGDMRGRRVIVSAGGTREYLDPVRFITNASTGALGVAVLSELCRRGASCELVDTGIDLPSAVEGQLAARHIVRTAFDMQATLARSMPRADALIMLAAVADYTPANYVSHKRKKDGAAWSLQLVETADVLSGIAAQRQTGQRIIGVSLEDTDFIERAQHKATSKGADLMIAVELGADLPFGDRRLHCALVSPSAIVAPAGQRDKPELAELIAGWLAQQLARQT